MQGHWHITNHEGAAHPSCCSAGIYRQCPWDIAGNLKLGLCLKRAHFSAHMCLPLFFWPSATQTGPWGGSSGQLSTAEDRAGRIVFDGDAPISWEARTNKASTRSTAEAEFMSISSVADCDSQSIDLHQESARNLTHTSSRSRTTCSQPKTAERR